MAIASNAAEIVPCHGRVAAEIRRSKQNSVAGRSSLSMKAELLDDDAEGQAYWR
jgi:hypothetical protein